MADATKDDHYNGVSLSSQAFIVTITNSISIYNGVELLLLIFVTFRRYQGLYFWSLFWISFGVLPYSLGYVVNYFELTHASVGLAINNVGWWLMITGQSFVLYSRLHLVLHDRRILRAVLCMIIVDAIIFHVPTTILNFCANFGPHPIPAEHGYKVYEKVQMTGFCLQEFIISGLYLWQTFKLLKVVSADYTESRRTMWQLASINIIIIAMDLALLGIEYANQRVYEQVFKGVIYSIKLRFEYAVLGKLVQIVDKNRSALDHVLGGPDDSDPSDDKTSPDFVDRSRSTDDPRFAAAAVERHSGQPSRKSGGRSQHVENLGESNGSVSARGRSERKKNKSSKLLGRNDDDDNDDDDERENQQVQQPQMTTLEDALTIQPSRSPDWRRRKGGLEGDEESEEDLYAEVMREMNKQC